MFASMHRRAALLIALGLAAQGCAGPGLLPGYLWFGPDSPAGPDEVEVYRRAEAERIEFFEREIARLRDDLAKAEASIVAMESGLRGSQSRADAVSALAEARIALDRVSLTVPWRQDRVEEARAKLAEARRQLDVDHIGSAVFFASRAQGITESLDLEARLVAGWPGRRLVGSPRVNLRAGPSQEHPVLAVLIHETPLLLERDEADWALVRTPAGQVGWVHTSLLQNPQPEP
jgi:uncharacterized small protein (DUF1192 family)